MALLLGAGCTARAPLDTAPAPREYATVGVLELSGVVERDGEAVYSMVEVMNTGPDTVRLSHPEACGVALLLLSDRSEGAAVRWDLEAWGAAQGFCSGRVSTLDLPPNTLARLFSPIVGEPDIRGDSLPAGEYASAMRIRLTAPADTTLLLWSGPVRIGGGEGGAPQVAIGPRRKLPPAAGSSLSRNSSTACVISDRVMRPSSSRSACAKKESAAAASRPHTSR